LPEDCPKDQRGGNLAYIHSDVIKPSKGLDRCFTWDWAMQKVFGQLPVGDTVGKSAGKGQEGLGVASSRGKERRAKGVRRKEYEKMKKKRRENGENQRRGRAGATNSGAETKKKKVEVKTRWGSCGSGEKN